MVIINLPPNEAVRRFVMHSFEVGGDVVIVSPVEHLRFRRTAYYPYTYGETPQQALCDLGKFAESVTIITNPDLKELGLIYDLAECALRDQIAMFFTRPLQLLLINGREAIVEDSGVLYLHKGEEYKKAADRAREIAASARRVGVLEYGDIRSEYCRQFPFDVRC
ncbi:MAG: hypothetical protein RXR01_09320 [Thermoproteus sp.]